MTDNTPASEVPTADGAIAFARYDSVNLATFHPTPDDEQHLLVVGGHGEGKTAIGRSLVHGALTNGDDVYIVGHNVDSEYRFAAPHAKGMASDLEEAVAMLRTVFASLEGRKSEGPDAGAPHIFVIIEDFTGLLLAERVIASESSQPEVVDERQRALNANEDRLVLSLLIGKIGREGGAARVSLILLTANPSARMLDEIPGGARLKDVMSRILLGHTTFGERQSVLRFPRFAPTLEDFAPRGTGIFEAVGEMPRRIQILPPTDQNELAATLSDKTPSSKPADSQSAA